MCYQRNEKQIELACAARTKKGYPKSIKIAFASLHFAKVLIARRATTFDKVYKSDNQSLLGYFMYGRFANTYTNKTF